MLLTAKQAKQNRYDANVRRFANGYSYEFEIDFNNDSIDCLAFIGTADVAYYHSDVARTVIQFVANNESYRLLHATDSFIKILRRCAKAAGVEIYCGFPKDQFGKPVTTSERIVTLRRNIE